MKKTFTTLAIAGALGVAAPALADDAPSTAGETPSPQQQCRTERAQMGLDAFRLTYGTNANRRNAFGKCVSKRAHATKEAGKAARKNASQQCKAERAADPVAFAAKYGTGKKHANAHGKCVSQAAKAAAGQAVQEQVTAEVNAAQACKAERAADRAAFAEKYGTGKHKRNAFGKCVSGKARA